MKPYTENDIHEFGLANSGHYDMDIVGFSSRNGMHYGWVNGLRVFVIDENSHYKPGDSVGLKMVGKFDNALVGDVINEYGSFLDHYIKNEKSDSPKILTTIHNIFTPIFAPFLIIRSNNNNVLGILNIHV